MNDQEIADVFSQTADLLDQNDWCQGTYAMDKDKKWITPTSPNAACFCLVGAIVRVTRDDFKKFRPVINALEFYISDNLIRFNDRGRQNKETIVSVLREAARNQISIKEEKNNAQV